MPRKVLDIDLIEEKNSDYTFFQIDEEENNDTLKALAQSYVTSNYKDETILNLQQELKESSSILPKEIKLESYNKYNNALDLAQKSYITTAIKLVDEALQLNPKDEDILNLRGLLKLLKCDFAKAFESFYTGQCYGNNELSRKYVDILSSDEFKVFLERYNHSIRFINEEMTEESMEIFDSLILEDPELIEPYVILILLYEKMDKEKEKNLLLERLRFVDADNHLFDKNHEHIDEENLQVAVQKKEKKTIERLKEHKKVLIKKRNIAYMAIIIMVIGAAIYTVFNHNRLQALNTELEEKQEAINIKEAEMSKKEEEISKKEEELDTVKKEKEEAELLKEGEEALYIKAVSYKNAGDYKNAIEYFNLALKDKSSSEFKSASMYQIAISYEEIKDYDNAIKYYKQYVYTFNKSSQFFDDAYYKMGMVYYNDGQLQEAKDAFYALKYEDPNSSYAKSQKVKEILKQ